MLFEEQISRKPDLYPWTKKFVDAIWQGFWTPDEFNFRSDYSQFKTDLTPEEQELYWQDMAIYGTAAIYQSNDGSVKYVPRNELIKQKESDNAE